MKKKKPKYNYDYYNELVGPNHLGSLKEYNEQSYNESTKTVWDYENKNRDKYPEYYRKFYPWMFNSDGSVP